MKEVKRVATNHKPSSNYRNFNFQRKAKVHIKAIVDSMQLNLYMKSVHFQNWGKLLVKYLHKNKKNLLNPLSHDNFLVLKFIIIDRIYTLLIFYVAIEFML